MCAGWKIGKRNACHGDSGGPLSCVIYNNKRVLVGVVSFGKVCASKDFSVVYANLTNNELHKWINDETGI